MQNLKKICVNCKPKKHCDTNLYCHYSRMIKKFRLVQMRNFTRRWAPFFDCSDSYLAIISSPVFFRREQAIARVFTDGNLLVPSRVRAVTQAIAPAALASLLVWSSEPKLRPKPTLPIRTTSSSNKNMYLRRRAKRKCETGKRVLLFIHCGWVRRQPS